MALPMTGVTVGDAYASLRDAGVNTHSYAGQVQTGTVGAGSR